MKLLLLQSLFLLFLDHGKAFFHSNGEICSGNGDCRSSCCLRPQKYRNGICIPRINKLEKLCNPGIRNLLLRDNPQQFSGNSLQNNRMPSGAFSLARSEKRFQQTGGVGNLPPQLVTTASEGTVVTGAYVYSCNSCDTGCCCGTSCCDASVCNAVGGAVSNSLVGTLCTGCTTLCCCGDQCCASSNCGLNIVGNASPDRNSLPRLPGPNLGNAQSFPQNTFNVRPQAILTVPQNPQFGISPQGQQQLIPFQVQSGIRPNLQIGQQPFQNRGGFPGIQGPSTVSTNNQPFQFAIPQGNQNFQGPLGPGIRQGVAPNQFQNLFRGGTSQISTGIQSGSTSPVGFPQNGFNQPSFSFGQSLGGSPFGPAQFGGQGQGFPQGSGPLSPQQQQFIGRGNLGPSQGVPPGILNQGQFVGGQGFQNPAQGLALQSQGFGGAPGLQGPGLGTFNPRYGNPAVNFQPGPQQNFGNIGPQFSGGFAQQQSGPIFPTGGYPTFRFNSNPGPNSASMFGGGGGLGIGPTGNGGQTGFLNGPRGVGPPGGTVGFGRGSAPGYPLLSPNSLGPAEITGRIKRRTYRGFGRKRTFRYQYWKLLI